MTLNARSTAIALALIGLILVMPLASLPARARSTTGPSMWLQSWRFLGSSDDSDTYDLWTIAAQDLGPNPNLALQSHMVYFSITYMRVTFTDYYDGDTYMYTEASGTAIMWGTLSMYGGGDDGPDVSVPSFSSLVTQAHQSLPGATPAAPHARGAIQGPVPNQIGYGEEPGFYSSMGNNVGGNGVLFVRSDGRYHYGTPESTTTFTFTGNSPETQSKVLAVGSFTSDEEDGGGSIYTMGASIRLTGMVYSFDYVFDYGGNIYDWSFYSTGRTATQTMIAQGSNGAGSGWYFYGSGMPNYEMEIVYAIAFEGTPWFPAAYWWYD